MPVGIGLVIFVFTDEDDFVFVVIQMAAYGKFPVIIESLGIGHVQLPSFVLELCEIRHRIRT